MFIRTVSMKIGNMRKPQEFVIYPDRGNGKILAQSDDCILEFDATTGVGVWARNKNGAQTPHLIIGGNIGKGTITLTSEQINAFKEAQAKPGDRIGSAVVIG